MTKPPRWPWILGTIISILWMLVTWPMAINYRSLQSISTLYGIVICASLPTLIGISLLIYSIKPASRHWVPGLCGVLILVSTSYLTYGAVNSFYYIGKRSQSVKNIINLKIELLMYADDNNGYLPRASDWVGIIHSYGTDWRYFQCPTHPVPGRSGYGFNANLSGKKLAEIHDPQHTIMLFEAAIPGINPVGRTDKDVWSGAWDKPGVVMTVSGNIGGISRNKEGNEPPGLHW
jgi:hypothetical protein